ncbi:MAG: PEP-CTERM sorting domain-containing protein [Burkholderiales bacterium]
MAARCILSSWQTITTSCRTSPATASFFVFGVSDVDLTAAGSSFTPQQFVPEPAPLALLGLGLSGMAVARKRKQSDRRA